GAYQDGRVTVKKKPAPRDLSLESVPHDLESERALLGLILTNGDSAFEEAQAAGLRAEDFFSPAHVAIFQAMGRLHARNGPIEITSVRVELEDAGELVIAGGPAGLGKLIE